MVQTMVRFHQQVILLFDSFSCHLLLVAVGTGWFQIFLRIPRSFQPNCDISLQHFPGLPKVPIQWDMLGSTLPRMSHWMGTSSGTFYIWFLFRGASTLLWGTPTSNISLLHHEEQAQEPHFHLQYLRPYSFRRYPHLVTLSYKRVTSFSTTDHSINYSTPTADSVHFWNLTLSPSLMNKIPAYFILISSKLLVWGHQFWRLQ